MDFTNSNKASKKAEEPKPPVMSVETKKPIEITDESSSSNEPRVDKILSMTKPSRAEIKRMDLSLSHPLYQDMLQRLLVAINAVCTSANLSKFS